MKRNETCLKCAFLSLLFFICFITTFSQNKIISNTVNTTSFKNNTDFNIKIFKKEYRRGDIIDILLVLTNRTDSQFYVKPLRDFYIRVRDSKKKYVHLDSNGIEPMRKLTFNLLNPKSSIQFKYQLLVGCSHKANVQINNKDCIDIRNNGTFKVSIRLYNDSVNPISTTKTLIGNSENREFLIKIIG